LSAPRVADEGENPNESGGGQLSPARQSTVARSALKNKVELRGARRNSMATMPTQADSSRPPAPQGPRNEKSLKTLGASESKAKYQHYKQLSKISLKDIEEKQIRAIQQYASGVQSTTSLSSIISMGDGRGIRKVDNFRAKGRRNQQSEAV
jgi:hypothetical protein